MAVLKLQQGTEEWIEARGGFFCASDAPAMMGDSRYKSRNQLLTEKKTGTFAPVSKEKQALFDRGHEAEEKARTILEINLCDDFPPQVVTREVEGLNLLASLDGMIGESMDNGSVLLFEHKLWSEELAENLRNGIVEPHYYWQMEHQMLVTGAQLVIFVTSDGTADKWEQVEYWSIPERRADLIAGWKQFAKDLETFEPRPVLEVVTAQQADDFTLVTFRVEGSMIFSNIGQVLPEVKARAAKEMTRPLETDQDFADKEALNKATKEARAKLKSVVESVKSEFVSFSEFAATAAQIDEVLQKMQAHGEKQVKEAKEQKKKDIRQEASDAINQHVYECSDKIKPLMLINLIRLNPDFEGAMKNKRTLESLQNAVDDVVAATKIEIDKAMAQIVPNQTYLREHAKDYSFLFSDVSQIINQPVESFQAVVKSRIADHVEAEKVKAEKVREMIRQEEEAKAAAKVERELAEKQQAAEPVPTEAIKSETVEQPSEEAKPATYPETTLATELSGWAKYHNISQRAVNELMSILRLHGVN